MKTDELIRALLEDEDDGADVKDFLEPGPPDPPPALLRTAIESGERYLGKQCRATSVHTNRLGETFVYGQFGKRDSTVLTLLYLSPQSGWVLAESQINEDEDDDFDMKELDVGPPHAHEKFLDIGSVSSGTMREEDLIPDFLWLLKTVDPERAAQLEKEYASEDIDEQTFCWEMLVNALEEYCPPYTYFGSNEGDGSDYGVWVSTDSIEDELRYENTEELQSMVKGGEMPRGSKYVVVQDASGNIEALLWGDTGEVIWQI